MRLFVTPQVAIAGALEPAYDVAGDSFDYTLDVGLDGLYAAMDDAIAGQFGADRFVTAQMALDIQRRCSSGVTSDDATLLLLEWRGETAEVLAPIDEAVSPTS